ncbi:MAG: GNAT family N-acetyltransferase [Christensenellaceae bacterium]|jgi:ribosomal protein S18 acetylase RimI-like enzyme|nr:GNAT family N-acetyltransferase [Christensenellaceae bacterium]
MNIVDAKGTLHDRRVLDLLSHSHYMPTEERLNSLADQYESDPNIYAFSCCVNGSVIGIIVIKHHAGTTFEIVSMAVNPAFRGQGIGSKLISYAVNELKCGELKAETDADAVGFYRSCGFDILSLGEKYPGVIRYLCTRKSF